MSSNDGFYPPGRGYRPPGRHSHRPPSQQRRQPVGWGGRASHIPPPPANHQHHHHHHRQPNHQDGRSNAREGARNHRPFDQHQRQLNHHNNPRFNAHQGAHRPQQQQQLQFNNQESRFDSREGVRDHRPCEKRQKTNHHAAGNNDTNKNHTQSSLSQASRPVPSLPQAQSKAAEVPQNLLGSTRIESEEQATTAATTIDLTGGDENRDPDIDDTDEYLPFREVSTGYWNDSMILQEKLIAAYPSDAQALQNLPPHSYEPDFKERLQRSYTEVIGKLRAEAAKRPASSRPYESSDDSDSDDSYDRVDMRAAPTDPVLVQRKLLKQVAENPAVHFGFQCYCAKEFDKWCCCPIPQCRSDTMRPSELVDHLTSKQNSGGGQGNDHSVVLRFLKALYTNVYQDEGNKKYPHEGITKDIKERNGFWRVRNADEYNLLFSGINEEDALIDSFEALKAQLEESQVKIDEGLQARRMLDVMEKELEKEKKDKIMRRAFIELLPEVTANDKKRSLDVYNSRVQVLEDFLGTKFDESIYRVTLPRSFDVREWFLAWRKPCDDHGFNFNHRCTHCYMHKLLTVEDEGFFDFELTYTIGFRVENEDGVTLERKDGAEAFLSEVWNQFSLLFFERKGSCFEPMKDERLQNQKPISKWMYCAIGRLIAFSITHGIKIPRNILPPVLWVHLFRGNDYLETDNCFQNFAFTMRAHEESDVDELCKAYDVAPLEEDEDYDSFLKRLYPILLAHAQNEENRYKSSRNLGCAALKKGFEYAPIPFDSKQKYRTDLQERLSLSVRDCVANDPWAAVASILAGEYADEDDDDDEDEDDDDESAV